MQNLKLENNIYMDILLNKPEGKIARQYLNKRNISKNTAIIWKLGYCPANLVPSFYQNEKYNFWKKLYGRLTIPIYNQNNELVSISGRKIIDIVDREKNPKYDHYHVKLRHIPELNFKMDSSLEYGRHIDELIEEVVKKDEEKK